MDLSPHTQQLRQRLEAAVPGDAPPEVIGQLLAALEPALQLQLLDVLCLAAVEVSEQLPAGHVELRLAGRDARLVLVGDQPTSTGDGHRTSEADISTARITLRLPDSLKSDVERAAERTGVSTNTWLVRAVRDALHEAVPRQRSVGNRVLGFTSS